MRRRWWIASGVLIAVLALASVVMNRVADSSSVPASPDAPTDPGLTLTDEGWDVAPWERTITLAQPAVLGLTLVVLGLAIAAAVLAGRRGARRRRAEAGSTSAPASPWTSVVTVLVVVGLVGAGALLVVTHGVGDPLLANGEKGIVPLDNIAAASTGAGIVTEADQIPAPPSLLGWRDGGAGLLDTTPVAAFAWVAGVLGLLLVVGALAYAVGRRRWSAGIPVGSVGAVLVAGGLVLAALAPSAQGAVLSWGADTALPGLSTSAAQSGVVGSATQETMPMPDVVGLDYDEAEAELRGFGIRDIRRLEPRRADQGMAPDVVVTQNPAAEQPVLPGDVVVVLDTSAP